MFVKLTEQEKNVCEFGKLGMKDGNETLAISVYSINRNGFNKMDISLNKAI